MIVNQWVGAAHRYDAIGDHARHVQVILRAMGHTSEIYGLTVDEDLRDIVRPFDHPDARSGDVTIFHYALPSAMTGAFADLPRGRVLHYHNITPAHYFAPYNAGQYRLCRVGREHLRRLVGHADLALGVSEFNRLELQEMGFAETGVMPIAVDVDRLTKAPRRPALERILDDGLTNILFVGRIAPNKRIDDYIRFAEHYKRYVNIDYRFIFVGRTDAVPHYYSAIRTLLLQYEMPHDRFMFTGPVTDEDLAAYYRMASVYLSLSEHEGFCVPLLEAMAMDVPILAYAAGAVPDTLSGSGVLFSPRDFEYAAELLGELVFNDDLRGEVIGGQRRRLADFGDGRVEKDLRAALSRVAGNTSVR
ncbi:MAG TPA: glycosyltransferase family 4 protein [Vicinamibacterales bacterium]|jgi:glycosyltransferase involved in cell wall biosynthesis